MKRLTPRFLTTVALASTLALGACSSAEEADSEPTSSTTVTSSLEETTTEATETETETESSESEEPSSEASSAKESNPADAPAEDEAEAPASARDNQPQPQAQAPAPAPAPQEQQAPAPEQAAPQQNSPASRDAVIGGLATAAQASGEDVNSIPPEILNGLYGCLADNLISQGANDLTHAIANVEDSALTPQQSQQMQVASETCYGQLMNQFG
ncbi:hypothetical protein [Corynebacterium occultum]|nr:hypothetical protein [Corynebacterium occultum]